ncbi:MAG: YHYH protein [Verrucomicrobiota bacterium]
MKMRPVLTTLASSLAIIATALEAPQVRVTEANGKRIIQSNGIPDHDVGQFPNAGNPHTIEAQKHEFRMTLTPRASTRPQESRGAFFGVAVNGVPFEAGTAEFWNGLREWNYEAKSGKINLGLDQNDAHVQPGGVYHYHGLPTGLIARLGGGGTLMVHLGWAADGFPIYAGGDAMKQRSSYQLKKGTRPSGSQGPGGAYDGTFTADYEYVARSGDLDECNGHVGPTPNHSEGIYHYVVTAEFPYMGRQWRGEPDNSFMKQGRPPGGGRGGSPGGGPPRRGRRGGPGGPPPPGFGPPPPGFGPPPGPGGFGPPPN